VLKTKDNAKFHIVLVLGAIAKNGKILIAQRSFDEVQAAGKWSFPGGKVERPKDKERNILENTLRQEIREEVGLEVQKSMKYLVSSSFTRIDNAHVVTLLFLCRWKSGKAKPLEDSIDVAWISKKDLKKYDFAEGVEEAIRIAFSAQESKQS